MSTYFALIVSLLLVALARPAGAAAIEVAPVVHELPAGRTAMAMTVTNRGDASVTMQLRAYTWQQRDGQDLLEPAPELVVAPAIFELAAGRSQVVRAVLRLPVGSAAAEVERSYRLLLDELPGAPLAGQVRMTLRISMPVFALPAKPEAAHIAWHVDPASQSLVASNSGGRRERIRELALIAADGHRLPLAQGAHPYVLAGAARHWSLAEAGPAWPAGQKLMVSALIDSGRVEVPLAFVP